MSAITESQDLGAGWRGQEKLEADEHLNNPTNVRIRDATAHKETGNAAFAREEYDSAVAAYCDGAAAAATVEGNYRSAVAKDLQTACFTNAAQARIKQQRWSDAAELCTRALVVDSKCVKALFRRGCARLELKEYAQARSDLASASELEPNNKAIKTKIVEAERTQMVDAKKAKGANDYDRFGSIDLDDDEPPAPPPAAATERQPPKAAAAPRSSAATPTSAPKPRPPAPAAQPAAADEPIGTEVKPGGGYRYWSKTPAAPRVIAQPITDPAQIAVAEVKGGASVWNAAGTYEERDQTAWAKGELTARLDALRVDVPGGGSVRCTGSKGFSGDAGIHVVRGKKRFLFDFKFAIPFEVELPESEQSFSGEVNVSDFSEHDQSEWEATISWDAKPPPGSTQHAQSLGAVGKSLSTPVAGTFCAAVAASLLEFIDTFKAR